MLVEAAVAFHHAAVEGPADDLPVPALLVGARRGAVARDAPTGASVAPVGVALTRTPRPAPRRQAGGERIDPALSRAIGHTVDAAGCNRRDVDGAGW